VRAVKKIKETILFSFSKNKRREKILGRRKDKETHLNKRPEG